MSLEKEGKMKSDNVVRGDRSKEVEWDSFADIVEDIIVRGVRAKEVYLETDSETLVATLRSLAKEIKSPDNVPMLCIMEAAERIEDLLLAIENLENSLEDYKEYVRNIIDE